MIIPKGEDLTTGGNVTVGVALYAMNDGNPFTWGTPTLVKGRLTSGTAVREQHMTSNATHGGAQDDPALSSWRVVLSPHGDTAYIARQVAGSSTIVPFLTVNGIGTIRVTTDPVNVLDLTTKQYVDAKAATTVVAGTVSASINTTTTNTKFATVVATGITAGRLVQVQLSAGLGLGTSTGSFTVTIQLQRNSTVIGTWTFPVNVAVYTELPLPVGLVYCDTTPVVGTNTYDWYFVSSGAGVNIHTIASNPGTVQAIIL